MAGSFVSQIKDEYLSLLKDIRDKCFESNLYFFAQTKRIVNQIDILYHDKPLFLWSKYPKYAVFKNSSSNKWYAIIMNIDKSKLMLDSSDEVEIINLKLAPDKVLNLLTKKGFYPAYHMNKKNWLSIILDDTLLDQDILDLISESYAYTNIK